MRRKRSKGETNVRRRDFWDDYSLFLKEYFKAYDPACFILTLLAFILFSFGMWYHDLVNVFIALGFWTLCHVYSFILMRTGR